MLQTEPRHFLVVRPEDVVDVLWHSTHPSTVANYGSSISPDHDVQFRSMKGVKGMKRMKG
jgi:hypothetical protein